MIVTELEKTIYFYKLENYKLKQLNFTIELQYEVKWYFNFNKDFTKIFTFDN